MELRLTVFAVAVGLVGLGCTHTSQTSDGRAGGLDGSASAIDAGQVPVEAGNGNDAAVTDAGVASEDDAASGDAGVTGCDDVQTLPGAAMGCQPHTAPIDPARCGFQPVSTPTGKNSADSFCNTKYGFGFIALANADGTFVCSLCM